MASTISSALTGAMSEPLLTGTLLYVLTRGPLSFRDRLLSPFRSNLLSRNGAARIAALITILKVLTSVGVIRLINGALNSLAWNKWQVIGRPGAPLSFGPEKEELAIITGGSSGFGYEMVKGFPEHARVVVLDVSAFPAELARCEYRQEWQWLRKVRLMR
jgi:all-trans-retinol dehydrogenase (NAD+)